MRGLITSVATSKDKVIGGYLRHSYLYAPRSNQVIANEAFKMQLGARTNSTNFEPLVEPVSTFPRAAAK
ncbi:hypothetical protein L914_06768 [Phytophthora nicotianae]|uniref:Uncharacterized protein n=1 Tax=Phytophthora nicotianae TaxID=4792 RepID=W2NM65_PHYNI|nr:hypothetical protein L914_06768 [Phytophthora nicotianae]